MDLRLRHCTILLTTGEIAVPQQDLRLIGSGADTLTLTTGFRTRVLNHSGMGTLSVERLSIIDSRASSQIFEDHAGCILSSGSVELHHARLHACSAWGIPDPLCESVCSTSYAGAIEASGDVLLSYSTISDSAAEGYAASGGGVVAGGRLTLYRSRLLRNGAYTGGAAVAYGGFTAVESLVADSGGGAVQTGSADIRNSTFTRNSSGDERGVPCAALCAGHVKIVNSTFSRNTDTTIKTSGGAIFNSTFAFNACSGVYVMATGTLRLESTIIAGNNSCEDLDLHGSLTGSHNLVRTSNATLPPDTLRSDPRLLPLALNGSFPPTNALNAGSPAINRGNNVLGLRYDQRGPGIPRTKNAATDIGAFER